MNDSLMFNINPGAGWEIKTHMPYFIEVLPINVTKDHLLGDECWCKLRIDRPATSFMPIIVHASNDKREKLTVSEPL